MAIPIPAPAAALSPLDFEPGELIGVMTGLSFVVLGLRGLCQLASLSFVAARTSAYLSNTWRTPFDVR